ncbi:MAG TPA: MarR family winged helix-turn-helix transcriptional regulator [Chitinophagales bacterium]|nr:MarR family winged helix-turn-helix transcriptional regulator [Chitinophagales bacterium]
MHREKFESLLIFQLGKTFRILSRRADRYFEKFGIPILHDHSPIMIYIFLNGDSFQQSIADAIGRDKSSVQRSVRYLQREGLVKVNGDLYDKRRKKIKLTQKGIEACKKVQRIAAYLNSRILKSLSKDEADSLSATLYKIQKTAVTAKV